MKESTFTPVSTEPLYLEKSWKEIEETLKRKYPHQMWEFSADTWRDSGTDRVLYTRTAAEELMNHFYWGEKHPNNLYEQQAGLAGYCFRDPTDGCFTAVVEFVIPAIAKCRSFTGARLTAEDMADVAVEVNVINKNLRHIRDYGLFTEECGDIHLLGLGHSHPLRLDVFMSETDKKTHLSLWGDREDSFGISLVVNPHRRLALTFGGTRMRELQEFWLFSREGYERFYGKKLPEEIYVDVRHRENPIETEWRTLMKQIRGSRKEDQVICHID